MPPWGPLALTTTTAALLVVPVAPALYELIKRRDAIPLQTTRHDGRITNFSASFLSRLEPLRSQLEQCCAKRQVSRARIEGMEVLLVGREDFDFRPEMVSGMAALMCGRPAVIPPSRVVEADVYAESTLRLGEGSALRAGMAQRDVILEKNSAVLRWLHAEGNVCLGEEAGVHGRFSAGQSIRLSPGCQFEHMRAPEIITTGAEINFRSTVHTCDAGVDARQAEATVTEFLAPAHTRTRISGDFLVPAGETVNGDIVVTGQLRLGPRARLLGSSKSYEDTWLEDDACVHGSLVSETNIRLGPRCFVSGPIMGERDVVIGQGSRVGEPRTLTTVSSRTVQIAPGCMLHGTVWARERGIVEG